MNLSSVVIQTLPENLEKVIWEIEKSDCCEYHLHDEKGRIIVTIEGKDTEEEVDKLKAIQRMSGVISAALVFAYSENELEVQREKLEKTPDNIPKWVNDPNATTKDIRYGGDLKGKL